MLPTQAGMVGTLYQQYHTGLLPGSSSLPDLVEYNLFCSTHNNFVDITVSDNKATVLLTMDVSAQLLMVDDIDIPPTTGQNHPALSAGRYEMEVQIDLTQDLSGKEIPDFRVTDLRAKSIPLPSDL